MANVGADFICDLCVLCVSVDKMKKIIDKAIQALKGGKIIGFPTDTVYGIGCDAYNEEAIKRIYELKKRAPDKPLILFVKDKSEAEKYAKITTTAEKLMDKFWPGKLTIIFKAKVGARLPRPYKNLFKNKHLVAQSKEGPTIAIRIPNYEPILTILKLYENPLATTSANIESTPAPKSHRELNIKPDLIIPGESTSTTPSTIIDLTTSPPTIVREGKIKKQGITKLLNFIF